MSKALVLLLLAAAVAAQQDDPATQQLADFKETTTGPIGVLTTASGAPVEYKEARSTLNSNLLSNEHFLDEMTALVRERIPERVVHAHGTGAFGYFETTHDISQFCSAKLFSEVGKRTPVAVRLSITGPKSGTRDTVRDSRGFSIKFYTEEGNLDFPCLNTPMFAFREPIFFSSLSHILKPNPATNLPDPNMLWDFLTQVPEVIFANMYTLTDFGMPRGYRHMPGFPIHTYQVHNEKGENSFMKFHFIPVAGIKNFNLTEANELAASDPNYFARDLYNAIANGDYPQWYLKVQIVSDEERRNCGFDIFDVTKILPTDMFPLQDVGIVTLNQNPVNQFAQIEQLAFCPGNLVPYIDGSPDKLFDSRRFVYREAQDYRLGSNFQKIPVNCPLQTQVYTYVRDGVPPVKDNGGGGPNYYPNIFNGPIPYVNKKNSSLITIFEKPPNNFEQAGKFYSDLDSDQQTSVVTNILGTLCSAEEALQERAVKYYTIINSVLGNRVANGLANCTSES